MDITSRLEFAAAPDAVFAMMLDKAYLERVCEATYALRWDVEVNGETTKNTRVLPAPDATARFTGPEMTVTEELAWGPAGSDGSRTAAMTMVVPGQPVGMRGAVKLAPGGPGTVVELTGELKVHIPLLGKKIEASAAPAVMAGFRTQQRIGTEWLAA